MAEKQKPKPKPKPTRKMTKAEQSERFKETARKLGADESGEAFERALNTVVPPKRPETNVDAIAITSFKGSDVSADGRHGLFKFQAGNDEIMVAIPFTMFMPLMAALSHESARSARIREQNNSLKHVFPCEWWEFSFDQSGQHLILSFRLPGGLEMSFQVARDRTAMMRETLETMQGDSPSRPPSGTA